MKLKFTEKPLSVGFSTNFDFIKFWKIYEKNLL